MSNRRVLGVRYGWALKQLYSVHDLRFQSFYGVFKKSKKTFYNCGCGFSLPFQKQCLFKVSGKVYHPVLASKNIKIETSDWQLKHFCQSEGGF